MSFNMWCIIGDLNGIHIQKIRDVELTLFVTLSEVFSTKQKTLSEFASIRFHGCLNLRHRFKHVLSFVVEETTLKSIVANLMACS